MDVDDLAALKHFATDAVSFQAVKADARWWRDAPPPESTGAAVAYVPSGRSWIAIGSPLTDVASKPDAVRRFAAAARAHGRRAVFFGVEGLQPFDGCRSLLIGLQSVLKPSEWDATLRHHPRLREQLRRARAKGVTVRAIDVASWTLRTIATAGPIVGTAALICALWHVHVAHRLRLRTAAQHGVKGSR